MLSRTTAFLLGVCGLYWLPSRPEPGLFLLLWLLPWLPWRHPKGRVAGPVALLFAAGFSWAALDAWQRLQPQLAPQLEGVPLQIEGVVDSLPQDDGRVLRFEFAVEQGRTLDGGRVVLPQRLRLSWYNDFPRDMKPGQRWRLRVKLKRPWALRNPGSFDYEQWLFEKGIRATGYVRKQGDNRLLEEDSGGDAVMRFRRRLQQDIAAALKGSPMTGVITALAIGERGAIEASQWDILMATGTNHLVAISGLHVGLVAGLTFWFMLRIWRLCPACCLRLAAPRAASAFALAAALGYAALAGFSIPTQRALIMLCIVLGAVWWRRSFPHSRVLMLALWGVVLLDPPSVLSAGFWLSFAAVAWILYAMGGRVRPRGLWWRWGRVQFAVGLGLLPMLLLFFQQGSLVSPLANLIAVPWVSLVVVPLTLSGSGLMLLLPDAGAFLLGFAATAMQWLWPLLQWLGEAVPVFSLSLSLWTLVPAMAALVWLLAPRGWPLRAAGVLLLMPALLWRPAAPEPGTAHFTLLDVGQGLAAVVRTEHHVLLFDTGPKFPGGFDTGAAVVVPFLREQGIGHIDTLVVSHRGNDHAGGAGAVLSQFSVGRILSSIPDDEGWFRHEACARGRQWHWDGVAFRVLNPSPGDEMAGENERSCVLKVTAGNESLLLTADIEAGAEHALLRSGESLAADILIAPHHGSKTSSSEAFIDAVEPKVVLFAVGYRNRYGFPHPAVVERYRRHGSRMFRSDTSGAMDFVLGRGRPVPQEYRKRHRKIWHM